MRTPHFIIGLLVVIGLIYCTQPKQSGEILEHTILKNEVYDVPLKTQVQLDVLVSKDSITEEQVTKLLNHLYDRTSKRTGFKHHKNPTNIFIYVYASKEKAKSGMGQWIGMISKSYSETQPKINISETQLKALKQTPEDKFGLSEDIRLEIWNRSIKNEDLAQKEADQKFPTDKVGATIKDFEKNGEMFNTLIKRYNKELAVEYNIKVEVIDSIGVEGISKGWAFPPK